MLIEEEHQEVQVGGAQSVDSFTIKASAKAFQILSSNLYSNAIGAVIRELSANAYDAHVMVGTPDKPFNIKLPNSLEPSFKIRDFGPGLSPDEINSVYTTFFESTKTNSNDVVGCLGLGSKSPFGVADSFTIISYNGGKKTIYSAFLNESKIPSIAQFHQEDSNEPNGIEIEIAIKEEDISTFAREVNNQLKYFLVKPTITGNSNFQWELNEEYIYEGTKWKMVSASTYHNARVVQGQISYPIDTTAMGTKYNSASDIIRALLRMNILFEVNIGEVNIAPSREALSYDEATVDNILKHAQTILEELPLMVRKAIDSEKTEWNARLKYDEVSKTFGGDSSYIKRYMDESGEIQWKNKDVSSLRLEIPAQYMDEFRYFDKTYAGKFRKNNITKHTNYYRKSDEAYWSVNVMNNHQILFYATEDEKAIDARVKQYMNDNHTRYDKPYIIVSSKSYRALKSKLGNPEIIKVEDLEKVRRKPKKAKGVPSEITVQTFNQNGWNKTDKWETETFTGELKDLDGYYVELDRHDMTYQGRKYDDFADYVKTAKRMGIIENDIMIYGLRATNMKKDHNLKCFVTHLKEEFSKTTQNAKYEYKSSNVMNKICDGRVSLKELLKVIDRESLIYPLLVAANHNEHHEIGYSEQKMLSAFGLEVPTIEIDDISDEVDKRYFMISSLGYYYNEKTVINYISQMDKLAKLEETDIDVVSGFIAEHTKEVEERV